MSNNNELPLEGERFEFELNLLVSNLKITKKAHVQRLDNKVAIVITCENKKKADDLVTSIGAKVI